MGSSKDINASVTWSEKIENVKVGIKNKIDETIDELTKHRNKTEIGLLCGSLNSDTGVCTNSQDCQERKGRNIGPCNRADVKTLSDDQVCCLFEVPCSSHIKETVAYFRSPSYPSKQTDKVVCTTSVSIIPGVTQLRLDLVEFSLPSPGSDGRCHNGNHFKVVSSKSPNGVQSVGAPQSLCGLNSGQHLYIPVSKGEHIQLIFDLSSNTAEYIWNVKVTQIESYSIDVWMSQLEAPSGCLQYYTQPSGSIKSFNFDSVSVFGPNQDYSVCFTGSDDSGPACKIILQAIKFGIPTFVPEKLNETDISTMSCLLGQAVSFQGTPCCSDPLSSYVGVVQESPLRYHFCGLNFGDSSVLEYTRKPAIMRIFSRDWSPDTKLDSMFIGFHFDYELVVGRC